MTVNSDSSVYYQDGYWNELPQVIEHIDRIVTGDPALEWPEFLVQWHGKPFRKALILNCGNGWVDRMLIERGIVEEAVGIDYSHDLLDQARVEAEKFDGKLRYYQMDTNSADFPEGDYDLVVNYAALHHIACVDRVLRALAELLPDDGVLVSHDYFGPHRNQYTSEQWDAAYRTNLSLPERFRQEMVYPHLPTMLVTDPTEAIHSELSLETISRYFTPQHERMTGGGIAYLLITFNRSLFDAQAEEVSAAIQTIIDADREFTEADPSRALFGFQIATVNKAALKDAEALARWTKEEDEREVAVSETEGKYYPATMVGDLFVRLEIAERERGDARRDVADLQGQVSGLHDEIRRLSEELERVGAQGPAAMLRQQVARVPGAKPAYLTVRRTVAKVPGAKPIYAKLRRRQS